MKSNPIKNGLISLLIILVVLTSVLPVVFGTESRWVERDVHLENLAFICRKPNGFDSLKYEYYKQQLIKQYSSKNSYDYVVETGANIVQSERQSASLSFGPMNSPWPMQSHDVHHTGCSPYGTANNPGIEKWRFYMDGWKTPLLLIMMALFILAGVMVVSRGIFLLFIQME